MGLLNRLFGRGDPARKPVETLLVNAYATVRDLPPMDFPHGLLGRRDRRDSELGAHLDGFVGYVMGRGDGRMTAARYHLWRHVQRVHNHVSFEVVTHDLPDVEAWALAANAVLFLPEGSARAPDMAILLSADGATDPAAALPYPADAVARRARTLDRLVAVDPRPPASMPPALGGAEVVLQSPDAVLRRALALLYVAARGLACATGAEPTPAGRRADNPVGHDALTAREGAQVEGPTSDEAAEMTWRHEAANTLLWSLGFAEARIEDSTRMADIDALWPSVAAAARGEGGLPPNPRPVLEILDALDRAWREQWVVRQARQNGAPLRALDGDIVAERHVALNWLTGFQNDPGTGWDEIDTPT